MTKSLNTVRTKFIFETIKMLNWKSNSYNIKIITILYLNLVGLLNNKNRKKSNFFITKLLL